MAQPLCAPLSKSWIPSPARPQPSMPSDGDSFCSPAWSSDSWDGAQASSPALPCARPARRAGTPGRRGTHGSRLGSGQRQSASEREKLRMRTLARALHELRRFLPPSVAPIGQNLTKIETLRLAIRYIGHLSALLGLSEDSLRRRRRRSADAAFSHRCPQCPDDSSPSQAQMLGPSLGSDISSGLSWGCLPACPGPLISPENLGSRISNVDPWVTPPYCSQIQSPLHQSLERAADTSHWAPPHACPGMQISPEPRNKTGHWTASTEPAELTKVYQVGHRTPAVFPRGNPGLKLELEWMVSGLYRISHFSGPRLSNERANGSSLITT